MKYASLLLLISLIFIRCVYIDYKDTRLIVYNNSNENIYVQPDNDTNILSPHASIGFKLNEYSIKSGDSLRLGKPGSKIAWESYIYKSPNKKLHLYIFSEDTLNKYTTDEIIAGKRYLQRIDMTLQELKARNWKIVYTNRALD